jgi:hypothetical protein
MKLIFFYLAQILIARKKVREKMGGNFAFFSATKIDQRQVQT